MKGGPSPVDEPPPSYTINANSLYARRDKTIGYAALQAEGELGHGGQRGVFYTQRGSSRRRLLAAHSKSPPLREK
jgi:hypothetical protein